MSKAKIYRPDDAGMRADSIEYLRTLFPVGTEVRTVVTRVAQSGMSRTIAVLAVNPDPRPGQSPILDVSQQVARVLGACVDTDHAGVWVTGAGMDMCFHLVYSLSRVLHADNPDAATTPGGNGTDPGYALSSRPL